MSTGKRLAKRSIIGTRVCAPGEDGKYYSGVIQAVKTPANIAENNNCINLTPNTRYTVRFDSRQGTLGRTSAEFFEVDLIGPGFRSVHGLSLVPGQKCFVTHNGREVAGEVLQHHDDDVTIVIHPPGCEASFELQKRLDEVRLLESRKSARLADQDTDFARLADVGSDRKRTASHSIDVPVPVGSRKRRTSDGQEDLAQDSQMDECSAALVLMSLSCSPHSPNINGIQWLSSSPDSTISSSSASYRSTPSPPPRSQSPHSIPLSSSSVSDEGIVMDYPEELPRKKKNLTRIVFQCTWPSCMKTTTTCEAVEAHVRNDHLRNHVLHAGEEEFYYTEIELGLTSPPPTLSHRDMARPSHEDPDYQRQLVGSIRQNLIFGTSVTSSVPQSPHKLLKLSPTPQQNLKIPISPRRIRGENKKCRKVYGMEHREQWCTQCKWKKACSRFGD